MNAFDWDDGTPSIFATPAALRYAKVSATSSVNNSAQQAKKKHVMPDIKAKPRRLKVEKMGRPQIAIDLAELKKMIGNGFTQASCAQFFGMSIGAIRRRLGTCVPRTRGRNFNLPITTPDQADRTRAIGGAR
jgi:hypothetical protein